MFATRIIVLLITNALTNMSIYAVPIYTPIGTVMCTSDNNSVVASCNAGNFNNTTVTCIGNGACDASITVTNATNATTTCTHITCTRTGVGVACGTCGTRTNATTVTFTSVAVVSASPRSAKQVLAADTSKENNNICSFFGYLYSTRIYPMFHSVVNFLVSDELICLLMLPLVLPIPCLFYYVMHCK